MKKITQTIYYEGLPLVNTDLQSALREFHTINPFATGVDWEFQVFWAIMTDEDCLTFCLKHPEYADRFRTVL